MSTVLPYHTPVLLNESVEGMQITKEGTFVDLTFGGGGHSRKILSLLGEKGRLLGFDQDEDAERNALEDARFTFIRSNFRYLKNFLKYYEALPVDAILADLGVSSHHLDDQSRGFSFRFTDGVPDMRMNKKASLTAQHVVNEYSKEKLTEIFRLFGELRNGYKLAEAIVKARQPHPINSIEELIAIVTPLFPRDREKKELTKLFQALRIEVNHELDALQEMLRGALDVLKPGGRLVVITYHSLEDRIVKNFMKSGNVKGEIEKDFFGHIQTPFRSKSSQLILPSAEEIAMNPRSRSAKLRIAEKK